MNIMIFDGDEISKINQEIAQWIMEQEEIGEIAIRQITQSECTDNHEFFHFSIGVLWEWKE